MVIRITIWTQEFLYWIFTTFYHFTDTDSWKKFAGSVALAAVCSLRLLLVINGSLSVSFCCVAYVCIYHLCWESSAMCRSASADTCLPNSCVERAAKLMPKSSHSQGRVVPRLELYILCNFPVSSLANAAWHSITIIINYQPFTIITNSRCVAVPKMTRYI